MDLEMTDRVVLVTGGSDGLGFALAERLVAEGARVAICGRDRGRLDEAAARLDRGPGQVLAERADVTVATDLERFVETTVDRWGRIDALVNNAAFAAIAPFESISDEAWDADIELKLLAAIRGTRLVLPHLRVGGGGAIVNVLNTHAKTPKAGSMPTSVSRAAGLALTKALSREFGPDNVRVNAVMIGRIVSGQLVRRAEQSGRPLEEILDQTVRDLQIPLGRVGRPEEFADLVALLVSPRGAYVSGAAINLDGGLCESV